MSTEYTDECIKLATEAKEILERLSRMMKDRGDFARAMDIDEAIDYVNGSVE